MCQTETLKILLLCPDGVSEAWEQKLLQQLGWESPLAGLEMFPGWGSTRDIHLQG